MTELITNSPTTKNVASPNLYNRNQQNHQTQQQIQGDRLHRYRARRLRFLINGDKYFQGIHYALNTEKIRSFDSLLNDLTSILSLDHLKLCKGVRVIFDLDGNVISDLANFKDGQSYLCSSIETFIPTDYRLNNNGMLNWLVRNSECISQSGQHNHTLSSGGRSRALTAHSATPSSKNQSSNQGTNESSSSNNISSRYARGVSSARKSTATTPKSTASHYNNVINTGKKSTTQTSDNPTSTTATNSKSQHLNQISQVKNSNTQSTSGRASARISRANNLNQTPRASPRTTPNPTQNNLATSTYNNDSRIEKRTPKKTLDANNSPVSTASNRIESIKEQNFSQKSSKSQSSNKEESIYTNPTTSNDQANLCTTETSSSKHNEKIPALPAHKHLGILDPNNSPKRVSSPKSRSPLAQADENIEKQDCEADPKGSPTQERNSFGSEVMTRYDIGSPIGDGHFSVVYCCMNRSSQELCALKLIDKSKCHGHDDMIYNEVKILKQLSHPNIVKLIEEFDYSDELYLILELVQDGDLFDAISAVTKFSEVHVSTMIHNLSSALTYLHRQGIVHRDIKPENLLISIHEDGSHSLKLADFGLAVELSESQPLYSVCGTAFYVSPEMLSEYGYDYKVDVWSTGVICFILLCGYPPFTSRESENNQDELFDAILAGDFKFDQAYWGKISQHAKNLIKCMLEVDPEKRYTAEQVFTHPWTSGISSNFNGSDPMNLSRQIASMPC